jgi:hypothetical protein
MRNLVAVFVLVIAACSSSSNPKPAVVTNPETVRVVGGTGYGSSFGTTSSDGSFATTITALPNDVWRALPLVYDSVSIPVEHLDQRARVIGNQNLKLRGRLGKVALRRYIDCGNTQGAPSADTYEVWLSVMTQVQPKDSVATTVSTIVQALARPINFSGDYIRCTSTRELETSIARLLKQQFEK